MGHIGLDETYLLKVSGKHVRTCLDQVLAATNKEGIKTEESMVSKEIRKWLKQAIYLPLEGSDSILNDTIPKSPSAVQILPNLPDEPREEPDTKRLREQSLDQGRGVLTGSTRAIPKTTSTSVKPSSAGATISPQDSSWGVRGACTRGLLAPPNFNSPRQQFEGFHARGLEPFGRGGSGHFGPSHPHIMSPNINWYGNRQMVPNVARRPNYWFCQDCNNQNPLLAQECPRWLERFRSNVRAACRFY